MPPVVEVIKHRSQKQTYPKHRDDAFKLGLCIEGGALRGVVSGGSTCALELLELRNNFDVVYGSSCGAFVGGFFVAGQALMAASAFIDHLNDRRFISLARPLVGRRIVNLQRAFELISSDVKMDWHNVINSDLPLRIIATDAVRAKATVVPYDKTQHSLYEALHASAHIPGAHGTKPYHLRGHLYWDAAILDPFGIDTAIAEGCSHLLIILSMPLEREKEAGLSDKYFVAPYLRKMNPKLADAYIQKFSVRIDTLMQQVYASAMHHSVAVPQVLVIAPPKDARLPGPISKNRSLLGHGLLVGAQSAFNELGVRESVAEPLMRYIAHYHHLRPHRKIAKHSHRLKESTALSQ